MHATLTRPPAGETLWLTAADPAWPTLLEAAGGHDVYHLPAWHSLAEAMGEGEARLFVYREGDRFVAMPLLTRAIGGAGLRDATSVYGYAGPVLSAWPPGAGMVGRFRRALEEFACKQRLVSVFSRLHPLLDQAGLLAGLGEVRPHGSTVSLDLTLPPDRQTADYSRNHRRGLERLRAGGFVTQLDHEFRHLDTFVAIYHENMHRLGANPYYLFPPAYFRGLREGLGERLLLVVCLKGDEVASAGLFTLADGIGQYHLGATADAFAGLAASKQVFDTARVLLAERGARALHLGGGRGAAETRCSASRPASRAAATRSPLGAGSSTPGPTLASSPSAAAIRPPTSSRPTAPMPDRLSGFYARHGKRWLDLALAVAALVLLSPLLLAVAALVRLRLGAPVLFRQERVGRGERIFRLLKFRTMTDARDAAGQLLPDELRLTPLGLGLRRWSLDELPQLINVVRGEMSLIGPRPLLVRYLPRYTSCQRLRRPRPPRHHGLGPAHGRNSLGSGGPVRARRLVRPPPLALGRPRGPPADPPARLAPHRGGAWRGGRGRGVLGHRRPSRRRGVRLPFGGGRDRGPWSAALNLLLVSMQAWAGGLRAVQCARVLGPVHVGTSDDRLPFSLASSCAGVLKLPPWNEANPGEAVERLAAYVRQHRIGAVVPSRVEDAKLLHHARPRLGGCLVFPISPPAVLDRLNNKWSFAQLCREAKVPVPPTGLLERAGDADLAAPGGLDYPVVVKPLELYGNRGVHRFDFAAAPAAYLASGEPHACCRCLCRSTCPAKTSFWPPGRGRVPASLSHHRTPSGHAVFQPDGDAHELGRRAATATDYTGLACIDLRRDARTGRLLAIECNPRCWDSLYCPLGRLEFHCGWSGRCRGPPVEVPDVPLPATAYAPVGFRRDAFRGDWSWLRLSRRNLEGVPGPSARCPA